MKVYENDIKACVETFTKNGVILYPTDTIWGLGCNAEDEMAIEKIIEIKKRPSHKSFILLMTDIKQLYNYIANPMPNIEEIIFQFDEPTTFIFNNAINLPNSLIAQDGSVAIRITKDAFCRALIKRTKKPLVSTSANISGMPNATSFIEIDTSIKKQVDYIVEHRQHEVNDAQPSLIYKILDNGELLKIR